MKADDDNNNSNRSIFHILEYPFYIVIYSVLNQTSSAIINTRIKHSQDNSCLVAVLCS